jgi:enoyl-CoA hydratase/carnithine racemase
MPTDAVLIERRGEVMTLTLNRPEVLNAIDEAVLEGLAEGVESAAGDDGVQALVITGAGRAFSAGVDLGMLGNSPVENGMVSHRLNLRGREITDLVEGMGKPVVAKVNGHCFTGALELVLACDLIYVAEEAKLADTHARWGLRPSWGMSQRLPRRVGLARARELSYTARVFTGREAAEWGLANAAAPAAALDALVEDRLAALVANSAGAIAAYKDLYRAACERGLAAGLDYELSRQYPIDDTAERLASFARR